MVEVEVEEETGPITAEIEEEEAVNKDGKGVPEFHDFKPDPENHCHFISEPSDKWDLND